MTPEIIGIFLFLMLAIPAYLAIRKHDATAEDYLTAKRGIHWFPAGVSAGVSMLSGFSFTALVGYSYEFGMFAIWFVIIRNIGEIAISWKIWPRLYAASVEHDSVTLSQLASKLYDSKPLTLVRFCSGLILLILLTIYVSSQLQSAGIALDQTMKIPLIYGIIGGGTVLLAYCFWGGIRSSIWTDNSQAILMVITLVAIPTAIIYQAGGLEELTFQLTQQAGADYLNAFTHETLEYEGLYMFSLLFIGFCILGQPHIFSRFITVKNQQTMRKAQITYYATGFSLNMLAVAIGIMSRAIIAPETFTDTSGDINAEAALFTSAGLLFPAWFALLIAAGAASAAMSTGDSQIQAAGNALIIDIIRPIIRIWNKNNAAIHDWTQSHWATKSATAGIIFVATFGALLLSSQTVFDMVEVAWATQGSLFFALFIYLLYGQRYAAISQPVLLAAMFIGVGGSFLWKLSPYSYLAYSSFAGMSLSLLWLGGAMLFARKKLASDKYPTQQ